jgi:ectoine hydroxylase-related dioxygenase (phytanoyl-CoA dioxygenase family)
MWRQSEANVRSVVGNGGPTLAEAFQRDGHVMLRGALGGPVLRRGRTAARAEIELVLAESPDVAGRRQTDYVTAIKLCERNRELRDLVCSPQLARLAATALGVERVRLLYDQLFAKPPGAVCTVWHQDQVYLPIDTSDVIEEGRVGMARSWVSLTALPAEVGGLHFVDGSHRFGPIDGTDIQVGAPGRRDTATINGRDLSITDYGAVEAGDATLHAGYTLHASRDNPSGHTRYGLAVVYVPDGARVAEPTDEMQEMAIALHTPGKRPGEVIDTAANPILWPAEAA